MEIILSSAGQSIQDVTDVAIVEFKHREFVVYKKISGKLHVFNHKSYPADLLKDFENHIKTNHAHFLLCQVETFYDYTSKKFKPYIYYNIVSNLYILGDLLGDTFYLVKIKNKKIKLVAHILKIGNSFFKLLSEFYNAEFGTDIEKFMYVTSWLKLQSTKEVIDTFSKKGIFFYNAYVRRLVTDFLIKMNMEEQIIRGTGYQLFKSGDRYLITRDLQNVITFDYEEGNESVSHVEVYFDWGVRTQSEIGYFPEDDNRHYVVDELKLTGKFEPHLDVLYCLFENEVITAGDLWRYFGVEFIYNFDVVFRAM